MNIKKRHTLVTKIRKKATQTVCKYKISATGFNAKGEVVGSEVNLPRFPKKQGGIHAEMKLMKKYHKQGLKSIVICRVNSSGDLLPIEPCSMCLAKSKELGIKIISVDCEKNYE